MPHVICEPCIGAKHRTCADVCPVDCIHPLESEDQGEVQLYIHPDECIDCGACVSACPVDAIYPEEDVPEQWHGYAAKNRDYFSLDRTAFEARWGVGGERRP
jgi:NAD-dependent dihydropyrimidine dehydrogenase PreA subunit